MKPGSKRSPVNFDAYQKHSLTDTNDPVLLIQCLIRPALHNNDGQFTQKHTWASTQPTSISDDLLPRSWTRPRNHYQNPFSLFFASYLGDQPQRSRNARENQPNADNRWTIVMLSPCAFSDRCWSQMRVLNRLKTCNAHQRVRGKTD